MILTLNIAPLVQARAWVTWGIVTVILVAWIELLVTIESIFNADNRPVFFPALAVAVLIAQGYLLGVTRSSLARLSRQLWRVYAFIALSLWFFLGASATLSQQHPVLRAYFALLSLALLYPSINYRPGA